MDESSEPPSKKRCSDENQKQDNAESFTPREYQIEILDAAKDHNTIACLGTGTGKTFIAVMLIREMAAKVKIPFEEGGKRIFFLVPTVPLVHQQATVIEKHTELKVERYFGEMNVDTWNAEEWNAEFIKNEVLVMTAEIFRIILDHSFISVSRVCLLIFDECHRACGKSPYCEIMRNISSSGCEELPRIFGLSASLLNGKCKPSKVETSLKKLEMTLRSTIVTASDYADVQKYGTDPEEILVLYDNESDASTIQSKYSVVFEILNEVERKIQEEYHVDMSENDDDNYFFRKPRSCIRQLKEVLVTLGPWCACCAAEIFLKEINKLTLRLCDDVNLQVLKKVETAFELCTEILGKDSCSINTESLHSFPNKLKKFLQVFLAVKKSAPQNFDKYDKFNARASCDKQTPFCIVFVEQRIVAFVLYKFICEVSSTIPEFNFMQCNFIVGHGSAGSNAEAKESSMSVKKQQEIVRRFRNKEFNILVATSVLEEGMDIQKCNLVLRFDMIKDFRSYVQSKGRARAQGSKFVMLLSSQDQNLFLEEDLCCFKTIEELLLKKCRDRQILDDDMVPEELINDVLPPYQPVTAKGSPRITLRSSIGIINRYCQKLPCDMATKLTPNWKIDVVDPDSVQKQYKCTLRLPINSPMRKPIVGEIMERKKLAKMAAALKACEELHKIGELDDHLLPFSASVENEVEELGILNEEECTPVGIQPGTNRRRQLYKKEVAEVFANAIPLEYEPCYLHVIVMDLVVPLAKSLNPRGRPIVNPSDEPQGFGLLTKHRLPKVPAFPIFTKVGKIRVSVKHMNDCYHLSPSEKESLIQFHRFLFRDTLWLETSKMNFSPDCSDISCLIVPVSKKPDSEFYLDWDFLKFTLEHDYNNKSKLDIKYDNIDSNLFVNAVVTRTYLISDWHKEKPVFHFVNKVHHDLTPLGTFEDNKYSSFKEFYKVTYNVDIRFDDQPMLEVERSHSLNLTKPLYVKRAQVHEDDVKETKSKSKQRHERFREYLVPELCLIHPFTAAIFRKVTYLPSIMHRLNCLLLAEQIRHSVAENEGVGKTYFDQDFQWPVFNLETSDKQLRDYLCNKGEIIAEGYQSSTNSVDVIKSESGEIISFDAKFASNKAAGPAPSSILQALTTKNAGDEFNLERLETIGDSFLKYSATVMLFAKYPLFDEGKLTQLRSHLICNLNLYQMAKKKHLPHYLVHTPFVCEHMWIPPCYIIEENVTVETQRQQQSDKGRGKLVTKVVKKDDEKHNNISFLFKYQLISDKSIADSMEALIGVYLLNCSHEGALSFMSWLGLKPFVKPEDEEEFKHSRFWPPEPKTPYIEPIDEKCLQEKSGKYQLLQGFEKFQERIGYKFKEPGYLLQAFTHPSYCYNEITDCYQRLEFVGDAVLDYLITRKLYDDPKEHSPGKLTDLRSALVNNGFFALLAAKYGYHKNLLCLSVTLEKLIDNYISELEDSETFEMFKTYGYYLQEEECFNVSEVEVPKALGDLFESVAGAIYLDSGMSLDTVWKIYYPMIKPALDHMSEHVPVSPVRELYELIAKQYELDTKQDIFNVIEQDEQETVIMVTLPDGQEIYGTGPNKKVAKRSAAKRALYILKRQDSSPDVLLHSTVP